jgi:hypothetical protein
VEKSFDERASFDCRQHLTATSPVIRFDEESNRFGIYEKDSVLHWRVTLCVTNDAVSASCMNASFQLAMMIAKSVRLIKGTRAE